MNSLIFDTKEYADTLSHIGSIYLSSGFPLPVFMRDIKSSDSFDGFAPWPYVTPPDLGAWRAGMSELAEKGAVSFVMVARPGYDGQAAELERAGALIRPLKKHFVSDPHHPPVIKRKSTLRYIDIARKQWEIGDVTAGDDVAETMRRCHRLLYERRRISGVARMNDDHFSKLLRLPRVICLAARDSTGIGAMIAAFQSRSETHLIHNCVEPRATKTFAGFLLMAEAVERWSRIGPVYMGGTPDGVESQGVGDFKRRFANISVDVMLVGQILNHAIYEKLSSDRPQSSYFPAYRANA